MGELDPKTVAEFNRLFGGLKTVSGSEVEWALIAGIGQTGHAICYELAALREQVAALSSVLEEMSDALIQCCSFVLDAEGRSKNQLAEHDAAEKESKA